MASHLLRTASLSDLDALAALEKDAFSYDLISPRQWKYILTKANATVRLTCDNDGYALLFFRKNSAKARLYSLAVSDSARGKGVGAALLEDIYACAKQKHCTEVVAETKHTNKAMQHIFENAGWNVFGTYRVYYKDGTDAIRYHIKVEHV
ncbi:MAG: N-acetyltransferase [Candidatus Margulisbacteria bacterium]|nr:N-acetyltransferase [Candidatus Margulisiibacteriota bacterium]